MGQFLFIFGQERSKFDSIQNQQRKDQHQSPMYGYLYHKQTKETNKKLEKKYFQLISQRPNP